MLWPDLARLRNLPGFTVRCSRLALVVLVAGCFPWGLRQLDEEPTPLKPSRDVWIWSDTTVRTWHGVVISDDSVSGVPWYEALTCDSCRRSMPRTQVDSMTVRYYTGAQIMVYLGVLFVVWCKYLCD